VKTSFAGVVCGGSVQLDERVEFADQCRVHVTIIPVEQWRSQWNQALSALDELRISHPIRSGGLQFTREQLHERN